MKIMSKTPVSTLQEYSAKQSWEVPEYTLISSKAGTHKNEFTYRVKCKSMVACGTAATKKDGKHAAAREMLKLLSGEATFVGALQGSCGTIQKIDSYYLPGSRDVSHDDIFVNSVGKLNEYCAVHSLKTPEYRNTEKIGPAHAPSFTVICSIGKLEMQAAANSKKKAKHDAAQMMLDKLVRNTDYKKSHDMENESVRSVERELRIDILDLKIEEPSMGSGKSAVAAREIYPELDHYSGLKKTSSKIRANDYHCALKKSYDPFVRRTVCELLGRDSPLLIVNHEMLSNVTSLLGLSVEYEILSNTENRVMVGCKVNSSPVIMDVGIADTYLDARDKAIANLLGSIEILLA